MNRIDALREVGQFVKRYQPIFSALPRDTDGKPSNIEIRKWLAVDPEMAIALAPFWLICGDTDPLLGTN